MHLQGTLQESDLVWLKQFKAEAESGCSGVQLSSRQGGWGHAETQQSGVGKPRRHISLWRGGVLRCREGSRVSRRARKASGKSWKADGGSRRRPHPASHRPCLGKVSVSGGCPQTWGGWGALGISASRCVAASKHFSGASASVSVGGTTLPISCAPPPRACSDRGCTGPMAAGSDKDTLVFLLVVHLDTPLRRGRLYCPCTVRTTVTTSLLFFLLSFLKKIFCYTVTPLLLCSNLGHLYPLEYVCKMLLFSICPVPSLKSTLS